MEHVLAFDYDELKMKKSVPEKNTRFFLEKMVQNRTYGNKKKLKNSNNITNLMTY